MSIVRHQLIDGNVVTVHKICVHRFSVEDSEYQIDASDRLREWESSIKGKFVLENSIKLPTVEKYKNPFYFTYDFAITAELAQDKLSEYYLRFDNK
jgi:hypothetical protein